MAKGKKIQVPRRTVPPPGGYRLLVLVGTPGSGKSTFASFLSGLGWKVVNQDTLGSRKRCENRVRELLQLGERVIVDRCNFNQSQRVTWIDLAVSMSLHRSACVAVWLDIPLDVCQARVQSRADHPTLATGPRSASIVSLVARDIRPPQRKEGFCDVLQCKSDRDLSEAATLLSATSLSSAADVGRASLDRSPSAPPVMENAAGGGRRVNPESSRYEPQAAGRYPSAAAESSWSGWQGERSSRTAAAAPAASFVEIARVSPESWSVENGVGGMDGQGYHSCAAHPRETPSAPWGGGGGDEIGEASGGGAQRDFYCGAPVAITSGAFKHPVDSNNFPSLSKGSGGDRRARTNALNARPSGRGVTFLQKRNPEHGRDNGTLPRKPKPALAPTARLLTQAEISASYRGHEPSPLLLEPRDIGIPVPSRSDSAAGRKASPSPNYGDSRTRPTVPPLGPRDMSEWSCRSEYDAAGGEGCRAEKASSAGDLPPNSRGGELPSVRDWGLISAESPAHAILPRAVLPRNDEVRGAEAAETERFWDAEAVLPRAGSFGADPAQGIDGIDEGFLEVAGGVGGIHAVAGAAEATAGDAARTEGVDFSEGEAFFVLEDMFGGILAPEVLRKVFLDSGNNLEKAVQNGFQACHEVWDRDEVSTVASSVTSDSTTVDALLAPGSGPDFNSSGFGIDAWDERDKFADVSGWTHDQVDALTELCLAFEGMSREDVIAALVCSNHDLSSAAQLLLDPSEQDYPLRPESGGDGRKKSRGTPRRQRIQSQQPGLTAASLLGATCGDRLRGVRGAGGEEGRESDEEGMEEEGDEGLTSDEYRARADAAAEEMKAWFQKAAEVFTRGGRNGGAAAAYPSDVGQRWKQKMEGFNLRAARETFRERNPSVRAGRALDERSVLRVLALPRPSQCPTRGRLSIDLHSLRKAEAVSVLEAILHATQKMRTQPAPPPHTAHESVQDMDAPAAHEDMATGVTGGGEVCVRLKTPSGGAWDRGFPTDSFLSLEIVVGRGAHSRQGVPRLRPTVASYLAGRGYHTEAVGGEKGEGIVVVSLRERKPN